MQDLHNNIHLKRGISPAAAVVDNTPFVSQIADLAGYDAAEFAILTGALADADATFTTLVEHGDAANLSDVTAVPDDQLLGLETQASFLFAVAEGWAEALDAAPTEQEPPRRRSANR